MTAQVPSSPVTGTGQDGDIQAGATLRYRDNGNGTITDQNTKLVWEKNSDDGTIHDKDNFLTWDEAFVHVAALNNSCKNDETVACTTNADCTGGVAGAASPANATGASPTSRNCRAS
jgi:hypothetical protein